MSVFKIQDVKYAIVETNGNLSVITNQDEIEALPLNIIEDGTISEVNIKILDITEEDVHKLVEEKNVKVEDIFSRYLR